MLPYGISYDVPMNSVNPPARTSVSGLFSLAASAPGIDELRTVRSSAHAGIGTFNLTHVPEMAAWWRLNLDACYIRKMDRTMTGTGVHLAVLHGLNPEATCGRELADGRAPTEPCAPRFTNAHPSALHANARSHGRAAQAAALRASRAVCRPHRGTSGARFHRMLSHALAPL